MAPGSTYTYTISIPIGGALQNITEKHCSKIQIIPQGRLFLRRYLSPSEKEEESQSISRIKSVYQNDKQSSNSLLIEKLIEKGDRYKNFEMKVDRNFKIVKTVIFRININNIYTRV